LLGNNMFSKFSSLITFLLPNFRTSRTIRTWLLKARVVTGQNDQRKSTPCDPTLPLENSNCSRMCSQVYRSMWTELWKCHLAQPYARNNEHFWSLGLCLGRLRSCLPENTTLQVEDIGGFLLTSSFPVISSSCPCLFWIKTEIQTLVF
jgi:hypothetical protein